MSRRQLTNCLSATVRVEIPVELSGPSIEAAHQALDKLSASLPVGSTAEVVGKPRFGRMAVVVTPLKAADPPSIQPVVDHAKDAAKQVTGIPSGHAAMEIPESLRRVPRHP